MAQPDSPASAALEIARQLTSQLASPATEDEARRRAALIADLAKTILGDSPAATMAAAASAAAAAAVAAPARIGLVGASAAAPLDPVDAFFRDVADMPAWEERPQPSAKLARKR